MPPSSDSLEPKTNPSLGDIAKAAGVSKAAASYSLRNRPGVSVATRKRVLEVASKMGYVPDARISNFLAQVREAAAKSLLPIAWLNNHETEANAWHREKYLLPYLSGASARSLELGYRLEEFWSRAPGLTFRRLSDILENRGIEGIIVSLHACELPLKWERFAGVAIEGDLIEPRLSRVRSDLLHNMLLAVRKVEELGYRRIGICLDQGVDAQANHALQHAAHFLNSKRPARERVEPLFYPWGPQEDVNAGKYQAIQWMREVRPEVVIGHSNCLVSWAESAGFRVPGEMGIIHLATDDDVKEWTGICSNRRAIGAAAVELLVSRIQNRQYGIPALAIDALITGTWSDGNTLLPIAQTAIARSAA